LLEPAGRREPAGFGRFTTTAHFGSSLRLCVFA
jgi:hypothetical protein